MIRTLLLSLALTACGPADPAPEETVVAAAPAPATAPAPLQAELERLVAPFGGRAGVAVQDVTAGWVVAVNGDRSFQQQSVFKAWVAAAALAEVDRGALRWDEPVRVTRADLGFPHQPIAAHVPPQGRDFTVGELIRWSVIHSDNASVDVLIRRLGGPASVQVTLNRLGVKDVRVNVGERELHNMAAEAPAALAAASEAGRPAVLDRVFSDMRNTATPRGTAAALARLQRGDLLSPASTVRLLGAMAETATGPDRLKAGTPAGWRLAHKTGTGGDIGGGANGINDIGLITAPDGRSYAVAVFVWGAPTPLAVNEKLAADVARAVAAHHQARP